jgi:hypothetical protein
MVVRLSALGTCHLYPQEIHLVLMSVHWRTQEFCWGGSSTNAAEDRENGDLGVVAP